jgi:hypothetical protein
VLCTELSPRKKLIQVSRSIAARSHWYPSVRPRHPRIPVLRLLSVDMNNTTQVIPVLSVTKDCYNRCAQWFAFKSIPPLTGTRYELEEFVCRLCAFSTAAQDPVDANKKHTEKAKAVLPYLHYGLGFA